MTSSLSDSATLEGALDAATNALDAPALIVTQHGSVVYANRAARWLLDRDGEGLIARVRRMISRPAAPRVASVTRLPLDGIPDHHLVILRDAESRLLARSVAVATSWQLTPRQAKVLAYLVRGDANKVIAAKLGCAEVTVETHVAAILRKSKSDNRVHVVARFWCDR